MPTIVIPNTVQISVHMLCQGQDIYNVLHFTHDEGTFINVTDVLTSFKTAWEKAAGPMAQRSASCTMVEYKLTDLSSPTGPVGQLASNKAGSIATTLSALSVSAVVKFTSGTRSRSGAGRLFHGPIGLSQMNGDGRTLVAAERTAIENAYKTLQTDMNAVGMHLAVASRKNSTSNVVNNIAVGQVIGTQRRRIR